MAVLSDSDAGSLRAPEQVFFRSPGAVGSFAAAAPGVPRVGLGEQQMALGSRNIAQLRHAQQRYSGWHRAENTAKQHLFHCLKTSCCLDLKYWCTAN